ncbi:MAG: histone [Candidatus Hodarchaeales archaeon]|jgi:histone H3/H4
MAQVKPPKITPILFEVDPVNNAILNKKRITVSARLTDLAGKKIDTKVISLALDQKNQPFKIILQKDNFAIIEHNTPTLIPGWHQLNITYNIKPPINSMTFFRIDLKKPEIIKVLPSSIMRTIDGKNIFFLNSNRPEFKALISDNDSGIDLKTLTMTIDGEVVIPGVLGHRLRFLSEMDASLVEKFNTIGLYTLNDLCMFDLDKAIKLPEGLTLQDISKAKTKALMIKDLSIPHRPFMHEIPIRCREILAMILNDPLKLEKITGGNPEYIEQLIQSITTLHTLVNWDGFRSFFIAELVRSMDDPPSNEFNLTLYPLNWRYPWSYPIHKSSPNDICYFIERLDREFLVGPDHLNVLPDEIIQEPLGQGYHTIEITLCDKAGNVTSTSERVFCVDGAAPVITDLSPSNGAFLNVKRPTISATITDIYSQPNSDSIEFKLNGSVITDLTIVEDGNTLTINYTPDSDLVDQEYILELNVEDYLANRRELTSKFLIDTSSPVIGILQPANNAILNNNELAAIVSDPNQSLIYAEITDLGLNISPEAVEISLLRGQESISIDGTTAVISDNTMSFSYNPTAPLADGDYTVRVTAKDLAGNPALTVTHAFSVDTIPPLIGDYSVSGASGYLQASITDEGSFPNPHTIKVRIGNEEIKIIVGPGVPEEPGVLILKFDLKKALENLESQKEKYTKEYSLTIDAKDYAGNSAKTVEYGIIIDIENIVDFRPKISRDDRIPIRIEIPELIPIPPWPPIPIPPCFARARIERLLKSAGAHRVSADSIDQMNEVLSVFARKISINAVLIARNAGRKSVKTADIQLAASKV